MMYLLTNISSFCSCALPKRLEKPKKKKSKTQQPQISSYLQILKLHIQLWVGFKSGCNCICHPCSSLLLCPQAKMFQKWRFTVKHFNLKAFGCFNVTFALFSSESSQSRFVPDASLAIFLPEKSLEEPSLWAALSGPGNGETRSKPADRWRSASGKIN